MNKLFLIILSIYINLAAQNQSHTSCSDLCRSFTQNILDFKLQERAPRKCAKLYQHILNDQLQKLHSICLKSCRSSGCFADISTVEINSKTIEQIKNHLIQKYPWQDTNEILFRKEVDHYIGTSMDIMSNELLENYQGSCELKQKDQQTLINIMHEIISEEQKICDECVKQQGRGIAAIEPVQEDPTWEAEALTPGLTAEEAQQEYKMIYGGDYSDVRGGFDLSEMERNR